MKMLCLTRFRIRAAWLLGWLLLVAGLLPRPTVASYSPDSHVCAGDYAPGVVLLGVYEQPGAQVDAVAAAYPRLTEVLATDSTTVWAIRAPMGQECQALKTLQQEPGVAFAELDYAARASEVYTSSTFIPNDPDWDRQWAPAKIEAPAAWKVVTASSQVLIAVVDSGLRLTHEDLADQVWTNPAETPANQIDDDGNGKVDDIHGWHFFHRYVNDEYVPAEDADVRDEYGHGTHVAGIAAAVMDNGRGIAGIAGGARLLPVKVLDAYGNGWYSDIAAGLVYAVDQGARVVNLSLGGPEQSETLRLAMDYARSHGVLVLASAGNTGGGVFYPAAYESVLAVAATDADDQRASFSNYGTQVDVAAPGTDIYSTWYRGNYFTKSGTSMASPHVAGVAGLIWSRRPDLSLGQVISALLDTADDVAEPGFDVHTGYGRVNAYRAVVGLQPLPDVWVRLRGPTFVQPGQAFSYTLTYGNRGDYSTESVTLSVRLADGLTSPQTLEWHSQALPAHSQAYMQRFTASPHCATVCLGWVYKTTANIQPRLVDQNSNDNDSAWTTRIARLIYLPVVLK